MDGRILGITRNDYQKSGGGSISSFNKAKLMEKVILNNFYKKLNKSTPNYVIANIREICRSIVDISCENGDNFISKVPGIKITIETLVNIKGELVIFRQDKVPDNSKYSNNAFRINSRETIKLVEERFNPLKIYTAKAVLVLTTDDYNNSELKWREGLVQFMRSEKLYYLVDVNIGKVEPVSY